ncbi:hypothetical protein Ctob_016313, partial [Chrysochromulina tobinii]
MFHNGPDAYDWIMQQVIKPPSTGDLQDMTIEFWLIEIITDVGISVNSIADSIKMLRVVNAEFPLARRFTDDQLSEKLLSMVEHGSRMFALEAKKELDAVEGVPGTPGVRQFQLPAPAAGGPRPRDLNSIIVFWQGQWESAVKSKALPVAAATGQAGKLARSATDGDGGDEFSVEMCYDADDTPSIEMLCDCCGGAGHKRAVCPSPKKHRSHMYLVALHTNAAKRKDDNALTKYGANVGGRRPPPRGQKAPFKAMPRRYSATMPFRRFEPGTPRPTQGQLQAARELLERELLETDEVDAERADAMTETELVVTDAARATTQQPVPSASRTKSESQVLRADTLENTAVISCLNSVRDPSTTTVKDAGGRAAPSASLLALKNREIAMPSVFSSVDFYSEFGSSATEVALPTPQPT